MSHSWPDYCHPPNHPPQPGDKRGLGLAGCTPAAHAILDFASRMSKGSVPALSQAPASPLPSLPEPARVSGCGILGKWLNLSGLQLSHPWIYNIALALGTEMSPQNWPSHQCLGNTEDLETIANNTVGTDRQTECKPEPVTSRTKILLFPTRKSGHMPRGGPSDPRT